MGRLAAVAFSLGLTLALGGPVRAEDRAQPPPPAGTVRMIQLGPEALVREDDQGNISMVDEPAPSLGNAKAAGAALGSVGGGIAGVILLEPRAIAAGTIYGAGEPLEDVRPARTEWARPAPVGALPGPFRARPAPPAGPGAPPAGPAPAPD